ncbi:hypothetical protein AN958_07823 [Leucoagaricus sp. SymC.cos]|nr:hypothetical protein AN958_07823 [Leucoagaricus sp. SymC.cos]
MLVTKFGVFLISSFALYPLSSCSRLTNFGSDGSVNKSGFTLTTRQLEQRGLPFTQRETAGRVQSVDHAQACYGEPLPHIPPSKEDRSTPWGSPGMGDRDGEQSCCSSLDEVRQGIDAVDEQLLQLLAKRAAYVREATRFKATRDTVDVPSRDRVVVEQAVEKAPQYYLPRVIAQGVFSAIINASVSFELCVVCDFYESLYMDRWD